MPRHAPGPCGGGPVLPACKPAAAGRRASGDARAPVTPASGWAAWPSRPPSSALRLVMGPAEASGGPGRRRGGRRQAAAAGTAPGRAPRAVWRVGAGAGGGSGECRWGGRGAAKSAARIGGGFRPASGRRLSACAPHPAFSVLLAASPIKPFRLVAQAADGSWGQRGRAAEHETAARADVALLLAPRTPALNPRPAAARLKLCWHCWLLMGR